MLSGARNASRSCSRWRGSRIPPRKWGGWSAPWRPPRASRRARSPRRRRPRKSPCALTRRGSRPSPSSMAESGPVRFHARGLARNIAAGARLAFFLPLRPQAFRASAMDYAVLLAFNFGLWVLAAAVRADFAGAFDPTAIVLYLSTIALVLFAALLLSQAYRSPEQLLRFAVALTAADPVFELIGLALPGIGAALGQPQAAYLGF